MTEKYKGNVRMRLLEDGTYIVDVSEVDLDEIKRVMLDTGKYCKLMYPDGLPSAQQWIPCSERLPEPRIDVWCYSDMGQMVGYYEENVETWYGRDYLELMVTAWMPLPDPYEERRTDE